MKPTFSTNRHAVAGKIGEERFLEFSKLIWEPIEKSSNDFTLPPIDLKPNQSFK